MKEIEHTLPHRGDHFTLHNNLPGGKTWLWEVKLVIFQRCPIQQEQASRGDIRAFSTRTLTL